jgi:protocatechuate 3,4-dioxygenase beta subunit
MTTTTHGAGLSRRSLLKSIGALGAGALFLDTPGLFAEQLTRTPQQTEGPYYPVQLPLDSDNDLVIVNDSLTPAIGTIAYVSGRVLTSAGSPLRNALVEIWQADNSGVYLHPRSSGYAARDRNFQGYGRFETAASGEYLFRTIKPGLYAGRTRHVHFKVTVPGHGVLTSQLYIEGEPGNARDGVLNGIRDVRARESVIVPFAPMPDSSVGALAAHFDIVVG